MSIAEEVHLAGSAFGTIAESYDYLFTTSLIGRSQRSAVWKKAEAAFHAGDHVLELNCGTGIDAVFLASLGVTVTACDASEAMIEQARARKALQAPLASIDFRTLCTERLSELPSDLCFDGVFSNFSGLNCVPEISAVARVLASRLLPGAQLLLCLSTRFCAWEIVHYLVHANVRKAFRRCGGIAPARMGPYSFPVYYPTVRSFLRDFGPSFQLRSITGIGIAVPPSYLEAWARTNTAIFRICEAFDHLTENWPCIRVLGDHILLHLERV
jgi:ubiquinone/menaquinone biosynthesis C-methylase UbiE